MGKALDVVVVGMQSVEMGKESRFIYFKFQIQLHVLKLLDANRTKNFRNIFG